MKPLKGGIWTNVEDEILKVAVMKYGLNQWARISSLLVRKTPKQCKARWNEWLDPRVKKTEWSKEEDEKLLHLAKVFPSQWGTVADLVGRTAQQCLERYERLLDAAQNEEGNEDEEGGDGPGTSTKLADARKLKPGEIDPSPETKPARPDPVDMDEDEKEMLAEARARLANTQGKKAKRKAREKMLDEAKRSAAIQKRKELVAAGLPGITFRYRGMDYNNEIPFEKKPVPGIHETGEELEEEVANHKVAALDARFVKPTKEATELAERRKDVQKEKVRTDKGFLPSSLERKLKEQQNARRIPLNLPAPQISDGDFEQIVKLGYLNGSVNNSDPSATPASTVLRSTYMTPISRLGGNETPAMSVTSSAFTNTSRTPVRDSLGINARLRTHGEPQDSSTMMAAITKHRIMEALKSLPKPKNDFEIVVPDDNHNKEEEGQ